MKTKQKILNAALKVLMENGFKALTQTRVAETAGISQGLLTYHFPTRNDLWKAVIDESKTQMANLRTSTPGYVQSLDSIQDIMTNFTLSSTFPRLMLALTVAGDEDPSLAAWFAQSDLQTRQGFRQLLADIGLTVDEEVIINLRATVIGATMIHLQQNTPASEAMARQIIKTAFQTLVQNVRPLQ